MTKRVEKLVAVAKPEKIKETELIDTPTVLPHAGCGSPCKFLPNSFPYFFDYYGCWNAFIELQNQHTISNMQRKGRKRNSLTKRYIRSSCSKLGHSSRSYDLYSDFLRSSLRRKHGIANINVQLCSRGGAFLLEQKRSVPW